jgi:hypothetical protein
MKYCCILFSGFFLVASCSQFQTGRSFLTEMDHDDSSSFDAGSDFPIMIGDTGRTWRNEKEVIERTPASKYELLERKEERSLMAELHDVERTQSEHAQQLYELHKSKFGTVSEKIYFLKLSHSEREQYLQSRGFIDSSASRPIGTSERMHVLGRTEIFPGMSKDDVQGKWGRPLRVEIAGNPRYENERWAYSYNGATKYIYFEAGKVEGWD